MVVYKIKIITYTRKKDSSSIYKIYFMGLIYKFFIVNRTKQKKRGDRRNSKLYF